MISGGLGLQAERVATKVDGRCDIVVVGVGGAVLGCGCLSRFGMVRWVCCKRTQGQEESGLVWRHEYASFVSFPLVLFFSSSFSFGCLL